MKMYLLFSAVIVLSFIYTGCAKDSNNPVGASSDIFFPQIGNTWRDSKDSEHTISFSSDDVNVSFGIFNGNENVPNSFNQNPLYGAFNNRDLEFIINRPDGDIKYKGKFTSDTTMQVQSVKDTLTLIKGTI